ncbi:hypothetical protein ACV07N_08700 [Roseivirga echinicomitans]
MKSLSLEKMEKVEGGSVASKLFCGVSILGFGVATAALFTTGVGAPLGAALLASQGYVLAGLSLGSCFID